jgi:hypothetical protein
MKVFDRSARGAPAQRRPLLERNRALAGVSAIAAKPAVLAPFIGHDRRAKSTSATRACDRALGCVALWVNDPMIRVVEVLDGADWCMMV